MKIKNLVTPYLLIAAALAVLSFTSAHAVEIQWFGQSAIKITTPGDVRTF
jgi:hypothetical protein